MRPSYTPERISGTSASVLGVVPRAPAFLLEMSGVKSSSHSGIPGKTPSSVTPTTGPWDSPKMLTLNLLPKVFMFIVLDSSTTPFGLRSE